MVDGRVTDEVFLKKIRKGNNWIWNTYQDGLIESLLIEAIDERLRTDNKDWEDYMEYIA